MASEIRVNSLSSRTGLSTVTFTDTGPIFSGITTFQDNSGFNVGTGGSIFSPASNTVTLGTNNAERLRIDSAGLIGIGTDIPSETLTLNHASGASIGLEYAGSEHGTLNVNSAAMYARAGSGKHLILGGNAAESLRLKSDGKAYFTGNLGLGGQTSPATTIHINNFGNDGYELKLTGNALQFNRSSNSYIDQLHDTGSILFRMTSSNTEAMRITSGGNIGVGGATGTDYSLLDGIVTNTANGSAGLLINSSSSSHNAYMSFGYGSGSGTSHADQFSAYIGRVGDNTLILGTDNNIRVRILSDGKVAIGGATANSLLDVHGGDGISITHSGDTFLQSRTTGTTGTNYLEFKDSGGAAGAISYHHNGDSMRFKVNGSERLRIDSAGTIKCGTSATLKAEINSAIGGHQFISQCSDNNNGFEIYQQHGSTTTRNTFAAYANTGGGGAQELQFSIRGDGCVTKPKNPAFSARLSSGNLNAANYNNVIIFNNRIFDNSNSYNTSNGRFTAPVAGKYYFGVQIYAGFDFSGVRVLHSKFVKNGSDYASADMFGGSSNHGGTSYHPTGCGHILVDLAVNDWVAFNSGGFAASGTGNALIYAASGTRFFGYLVG